MDTYCWHIVNLIFGNLEVAFLMNFMYLFLSCLDEFGDFLTRVENFR